ncbi:MAG: DUF309 domain-containing protein [bacterium]|jgi:predicted metal-dependent hydrolase|nr:DUF309 domain-containing protein [bacterium]
MNGGQSPASTGHPAPEEADEYRRLAAKGLARACAGRFFAAHESWEALWLRLHGDERVWIQALLQADVALHHAAAGNMAGAASLREKARVKLARLASDEFRLPVWAQDLGLPEVVDLLDRLLAWQPGEGGVAPPLFGPP